MRGLFFRMGEKVKRDLLIVIVSLVLPMSSFAASYKLDESHTLVGFKIKHLVISKVDGRFNKFHGTFIFDEKTKKVSDIVAKIDAESVDTNEPDRDKDLRSSHFFEVKKFPYLEFKGTKVVYKDEGPSQIEGNLTIHGITKPVTLAVEYKGAVDDPWGNHRVAFSATTRIKRQDFGLTWNKTLDKGGVMIGDDVDITIEGEGVINDEGKEKQ